VLAKASQVGSIGAPGALGATLLLAGFVAVSLPQSLATHRHFHSWSFIPGSPDHLESVQLTTGLWTQRYDTYVGVGHQPQMFYEYPTGLKLVRARPHESIKGYGEYLGLMVEHPITLATVFLHHLVNGVDQRYSTPYIERLDTGSHRWMRIAGFLIVFLALLRLLWPAARRSLGPARWRYPIALLVCCLTSVPSAVETRYLLPIDLLAYVMVIAPGWPRPTVMRTGGFRDYRTAVMILAAFALFAVVVWQVVGSASANLHFGFG